jgi:prepilin-type N-terminal cleavage/methylation domain-containing protein/prepilin-type processing-associated H-X9-DG protein
MSQQRRLNQPRAFTLIELLVVIAIIAILAAILFPVFAQAREKARSAACLSNSKQIATAIALYVQDYDETFPFSSDFSVAGIPGSPVLGGYRYWADYIFPYVKNGGDSGEAGGRGTGVYGAYQKCPSEPDWWTGYSYNIELGYYPLGQLNDNVVNDNRVGVTLAQIKQPSDLIALVDSSVYYAFVRNNLGRSHNDNTNSAYYFIFRYHPQAPATCMNYYNWPQSATTSGIAWTSGVKSARHQGGVNIAFADGHAKWMNLGAEFCKRERQVKQP